MLNEIGLEAEIAGIEFDAWRVEMLAGDLDAAEETLRRAYTMLDEMGEKHLLPTVTGLLAQTLYGLGRFDGIEALVETTRELGSEEDVDVQALWRCVQAKLLARAGRFDDGEALAREALSLLDVTDAAILEYGTLLDLAEVQRLAGRVSEMGSTLARALEVAERKGSVVLEEGVRRLAGEPLDAPVSTA
jgi:ATP/maltotriose-dependent transcriptional regulator MalT